MAYDGRLDLLDRYLHLPIARPDARRRVGGEPTDDLLGRSQLRRVVRLRNLRVQGRSEGPGLRSVDGDLDEPDPLLVLPQPPLREPAVDVISRDPPLVGLAVHVGSALDLNSLVELVEARAEVHGDPAALGEVVVVRPGPIGLDVVSSGGCRAAVDLHAAVHSNPPLSPTIDNRETAGQRPHRRPSRYETS